MVASSKKMEITEKVGLQLIECIESICQSVAMMKTTVLTNDPPAKKELPVYCETILNQSELLGELTKQVVEILRPTTTREIFDGNDGVIIQQLTPKELVAKDRIALYPDSAEKERVYKLFRMVRSDILNHTGLIIGYTSIILKKYKRNDLPNEKLTSMTACIDQSCQKAFEIIQYCRPILDISQPIAERQKTVEVFLTH